MCDTPEEGDTVEEREISLLAEAYQCDSLKMVVQGMLSVTVQRT